MRKIVLTPNDFELFDTEISSVEFFFYQKHKDAFRRMWKEQGKPFWVSFIMTFRKFSVEFGSLKEFQETHSEFQHHVDKAFILIHENFVDAKASQAHAFFMDIVSLAQNKHTLQYLESHSYAKDPFYNKETRDVFRRLFGPPTEKASYFKVYVLLPIYLKFGAAVCICLRRWLDAEEVNSMEIEIESGCVECKGTEKALKAVQLLYQKEVSNGHPKYPAHTPGWPDKMNPRNFDPKNPLYSNPDDTGDWLRDVGIKDYARFMAYSVMTYNAEAPGVKNENLMEALEKLGEEMQLGDDIMNQMKEEVARKIKEVHLKEEEASKAYVKELRYGSPEYPLFVPGYTNVNPRTTDHNNPIYESTWLGTDWRDGLSREDYTCFYLYVFREVNDKGVTSQSKKKTLQQEAFEAYKKEGQIKDSEGPTQIHGWPKGRDPRNFDEQNPLYNAQQKTGGWWFNDVDIQDYESLYRYWVETSTSKGSTQPEDDHVNRSTSKGGQAPTDNSKKQSQSAQTDTHKMAQTTQCNLLGSESNGYSSRVNTNSGATKKNKQQKNPNRTKLETTDPRDPKEQFTKFQTSAFKCKEDFLRQGLQHLKEELMLGREGVEDEAKHAVMEIAIGGLVDSFAAYEKEMWHGVPAYPMFVPNWPLFKNPRTHDIQNPLYNQTSTDTDWRTGLTRELYSQFYQYSMDNYNMDLLSYDRETIQMKAFKAHCIEKELTDSKHPTQVPGWPEGKHPRTFDKKNPLYRLQGKTSGWWFSDVSIQDYESFYRYCDFKYVQGRDSYNWRTGGNRAKAYTGSTKSDSRHEKESKASGHQLNSPERKGSKPEKDSLGAIRKKKQKRNRKRTDSWGAGDAGITMGIPNTAIARVRVKVRDAQSQSPLKKESESPTSEQAEASKREREKTIDSLAVNVTKCQHFLETIITVASKSSHTPSALDEVTGLVQYLIDGRLTAEEFTEMLLLMLKSEPQPHLIPLLKSGLPLLRILMFRGKMSIKGIRVPPADLVKQHLTRNLGETDLEHQCPSETVTETDVKTQAIDKSSSLLPIGIRDLMFFFDMNLEKRKELTQQYFEVDPISDLSHRACVMKVDGAPQSILLHRPKNDKISTHEFVKLQLLRSTVGDPFYFVLNATGSVGCSKGTTMVESYRTDKARAVKRYQELLINCTGGFYSDSTRDFDPQPNFFRPAEYIEKPVTNLKEDSTLECKAKDSSRGMKSSTGTDVDQLPGVKPSKTENAEQSQKEASVTSSKHDPKIPPPVECEESSHLASKSPQASGGQDQKLFPSGLEEAVKQFLSERLLPSCEYPDDIGDEDEYSCECSDYDIGDEDENIFVRKDEMLVKAVQESTGQSDIVGIPEDDKKYMEGLETLATLLQYTNEVRNMNEDMDRQMRDACSAGRRAAERQGSLSRSKACEKWEEDDEEDMKAFVKKLMTPDEGLADCEARPSEKDKDQELLEKLTLNMQKEQQLRDQPRERKEALTTSPAANAANSLKKSPNLTDDTKVKFLQDNDEPDKKSPVANFPGTKPKTNSPSNNSSASASKKDVKVTTTSGARFRLVTEPGPTPDKAFTSFQFVSLGSSGNSSNDFVLPDVPTNVIKGASNAEGTSLHFDIRPGANKVRMQVGKKPPSSSTVKPKTDAPPVTAGAKKAVDQSTKQTDASKNESLKSEEAKKPVRFCSTCGLKEPKPKTFKKCSKCKDEGIKESRYYCGRECQVEDWKERHKDEHKNNKLN